jgi:hypothetical protein
MQYDTDSQIAQESSEASQELASALSTLLAALLITLDAQLDVRLVRTFLATIAVMMQFRNRAQGFLLSEWGAYLLSPQHAPAGTKRISHLLRSSKWGSALSERFLWERANARLEQLEEQQRQALCIWDGRVVEKAESEKVEGLCAVGSSKAKRLRKLKPGLFNQLSGPPIVVRGMEWSGVAKASTPPRNDRWNRSCFFASQEHGANGSCTCSIAAMRRLYGWWTIASNCC